MLGPLAVFLLIEFLDEVVFSVREAAWPAIRADLGLDYRSIGVLLALPAFLSSVVEPFLALASGYRRRAALVAAGGLAFALGLVLFAVAGNFVVVLMAFCILYPASGAFVSLTQATLMDMEPLRHEANMARWTLAGSVGVVVGPLALSATSRMGSGWRAVLLGCAVVTVLLVSAGHVHRPTPTSDTTTFRTSLRTTVTALRSPRVVRWLVLLELTDLLGDVFAGFLALYFVDVVHVRAGDVALVVVLWSVAALIGDALLVPLLERVSGIRYLRVSALVTLLIYPAFLVVPSLAGKLVLLAVVGFLHAGWYAIPQGRLYTELHGQSNVVLAVSNIAGLVAGLLPLLLGSAAARWGLSSALWICGVAPLALLIGLSGKDTLHDSSREIPLEGRESLLE